MGTSTRYVASILGIALGLAISVSGSDAAEEPKGPEFKEAVYYGGAGNQGAGYPGEFGMGLAVGESHLYLSGVERTSSGNDQALGMKSTVPPGPSPVWTVRWPNDPNLQRPCKLPGLAVTGEGVYLVGDAKADTVSRYGVWGQTSVLVKYALSGPTGSAAGGALWVARPVFFPSYNGTEGLLDVVAVKEGGSTVLYATGLAEAAVDNQTAILAKFDLNGALLWWKALGEAKEHCLSHGLRIAVLNGHIYVTGTVNPNTLVDGGNHWRADLKPTLWKVSPSGALVWTKTYAKSVLSRWGGAVVGVGDSLYVATTLWPGSDGNAEVLLLRYDEGGTLLWDKVWGTLKEDVAHGIAAAGNRLYVVGDTRGWVGGERDVFLLEADAQTGEVLSVNYHGGKFDDRAFRISVAGPDLYLLGDSYSNTNFANLDVMLLRYALSRPPPVLTVSLDIKPGSAENPIHPTAPGKIPVALLTTTAFNAPVEADPATLTFGRTGDEKSLAGAKCQSEDVNGDGLADLICHADNLTAAFQVGDTRGILKGQTRTGRLFVGTDVVTIVPHQEKKQEKKEEQKKVERPEPPAVKPPAPRPIAPPATPPVTSKRSSARTEAEAIKSLRRDGAVAY